MRKHAPLPAPSVFASVRQELLFDARPVQRTSITPRHFRGDAALVDGDELRRIDLPGFLLPEPALRFDSFAVLLGSVE